jgi:hypothetical protein
MLGLGLGLCDRHHAAGGIVGGGVIDPILLIVAGQSNSKKFGTTDLTPDVKYTTLTNAYMYVHASTSFVAYNCSVNSDAGTNCWGSEAEFIRQANINYPGRPVYVVKFNTNGTQLAMDGSNDWSPVSTGEQFESLETRVTGARAWLASHSVTIGSEVVSWNQGESDANDATRAAAYKANFDAFLVAFRARISATALFVVERIRPYSGDWRSVRADRGQRY